MDSCFRDVLTCQLIYLAVYATLCGSWSLHPLLRCAWQQVVSSHHVMLSGLCVRAWMVCSMAAHSCCARNWTCSSKLGWNKRAIQGRGQGQKRCRLSTNRVGKLCRQAAAEVLSQSQLLAVQVQATALLLR